MRIRSSLLFGVLVVAAGCAKEAPPPDPVRPVQLFEVRVGNLAPASVFAGEVKPRHEADLAFRVGGKVVARSVDVGVRVARGQVLARIDPADTGLAVQGAKAAVAAAKTEAAFARAELDRYQGLFRDRFVSASALEAKRNSADATRARLEQAQAQLATAENQAAYTTLVAPNAGVITTVAVETGQVVAAGQAVLKLARDDEREVAISVPEGRLSELKAAREMAVFLVGEPQRLYPARVREVAPAVDPVTRTFAVRVAVEGADARLQWGMTANVGLRGDAAPDAALVPPASLYRTEGRPAVWVFDRATRRVALREVTIGQFREDGVVVASGLADGEWIVATGANKLQPGQEVRPYEGGGAGAVQAKPAARP